MGNEAIWVPCCRVYANSIVILGELLFVYPWKNRINTFALQKYGWWLRERSRYAYKDSDLMQENTPSIGFSSQLETIREVEDPGDRRPPQSKGVPEKDDR